MDGSAVDAATPMTTTGGLVDCWFAVATSAEVGEAPSPVTLLETDYVLWRGDDGEITAVRDRCSHREARLSLGSVTNGCIQCPYHGWRFDPSGRCIAVPSSGSDTGIPPAAHLTPLSVEEHYGLVWLCPGTASGPVPHLAVDADPSFTRLNTSMQTWNVSATRMADNMLDIAHFPFTHVGTFGHDAETVVPRFSLTELDDTFYGYEYRVTVDNDGDAKAMSGDERDTVSLEMSTGFAMPFSIRSTMSWDNGIDQVLFMTMAPITPDRSYYTFVLWRNDDVSETGSDIVDFELQVTDEDRQMLENLRGELPLHPGGVADVAADRASVEWRRRYRHLISGPSV